MDNDENAKIDLSGFDKILTTPSKTSESSSTPPQVARAESSTPTKVEDKPSEVKTPETKTPDTKPTDAATAPQPKAEVPNLLEVAKTPERVFEGLDPEEAPLFKQMSNDAYNKLYPKYKELRAKASKVEELETKLKTPTTPIHPQSYVLDPQYQQAALTQQQAQSEVAYWKQQFAKIRKGEDWEDLQVNGDGKLVKVTRPADADAEAELQQRMAMGQQIVIQQQQAMSWLEQNHLNNYQQYVGRIKAVESQYFPGMEEDKLKENKHYKAINDALVALNQHHNPTNGVLSKLYVAFMNLAEKWNAKIAEEAKKAEESKVQAKAGPNSDNIASGTTTKKDAGEEKLSEALDGFDKIMKMRG